MAENNKNLKQVIMASSTKNINIQKNVANPNLLQSYKIITTALEKLNKYSAPISLSAYTHEKVIKKYKVFKDKLTGLERFAKSSGNPKLGERAARILDKLPKLNKAELKVEIAKLGEATKNIRKPGLSTKFLEVAEESKKLIPSRPKTMEVASKVGKWIPLAKTVLPLLDAYTVGSFFNKLGSKKKPTFGEGVDAAISALSLAGLVVGTFAPPVGAAMETLALTASVAKFLYDKLPPLPPNSKLSKVKISGPEDNLLKNYAIQPVIPVPRNARGTSYFAGGLSLVGEEGPELVNLPRGSQVLSNSRTQSLLKGMGSGSAGISVKYSPQIIIQGNADAHVMKTASDNSYADFERKFNALMDRKRRLSFAGGF